MINRLRLVTAALLAGVVGSAASAGVIENASGVFDRTIRFFDPIGQSFVADDVELFSAELVFSTANAGTTGAPIVTALYAGAGVGGAPIATSSIDLPIDLPSSSGAIGPWIDLDLGPVALTPGQTYTIAVSTDSSRNAVVYGTNNGYVDGQVFHGPGAVSPAAAGDDLRFRVTTVPEPASLALVGAGLALVGARRRR